MTDVTVAGRRLHSFDSLAAASRPGARTPLLLLHGAGGNYLQWPPHLRRLPERSVYALDLPAHGKSDGPVCTTLDELVEVVTAWLDARRLARVVVGGHSLGGALALATALAQPQRASGLVMVASGARLPVPAELLRLVQTDAATTAEAFVARIYSPAASPKLRDRGVRALMDLPAGVLTADLTLCAGVDLGARLPEVAAPVLALVGSEDRMTPPALSAELVVGLPQATLQTLPGASHMAMVETPAQVTGPIGAFLDKFL